MSEPRLFIIINDEQNLDIFQLNLFPFLQAQPKQQLGEFPSVRSACVYPLLPHRQANSFCSPSHSFLFLFLNLLNLMIPYFSVVLFNKLVSCAFLLLFLTRH